MNFDYIPTLQIQRDLYAMPRGFERFWEYIATMVDPETHDLKLPLVAMNPMGKDHIPALLDQFLAFDADGIAAKVTVDVQAKLLECTGEFKITTVISDDAQGAWTHRVFNEFGHRFQSKPIFRRGWLTVILWTSEAPDPLLLRQNVAATLYRGAYLCEHGFARTLAEMMRQEGYAMALADCATPALEADDLDYTRQVIEPLRNSTDQATQIAALFGDEAARSVGYPPLGLSQRAGLALALTEGKKRLGEWV